MRKNISALFAGILFGLGLCISGMSNPDKVQNFLNVLGDWDPSLFFVLMGAVIVTFIGYAVIFKRSSPLLADEFYLPTKSQIDKRLVLGAVFFGIGWGMTGYCPGPALSAVTFGGVEPLIFVASMLFGFTLNRLYK